MLQLVVMLICIVKAITTAVVNPNMTCDLIKEPALLIREKSTNQQMLLNPSSNDVTSANKVHLDDYKGNEVVQQTRNTLIIFYWNIHYMMKVHNLITGRSNGWFTFVDDPYLAWRSAFFTLADTIYYAKYFGGFMEYNKTQNKFVQSNTITLPGDYQPNFIVEIEHRPCFLVKSDSHRQFNCYHVDQNKWKVRAKLFSAPSDSRISSAQVYHNQIFICYWYDNDQKDQCIVYNIKTGNNVKQSKQFPSLVSNWYDIPPTGVVTVGGQYYVVSNTNKQLHKGRLSDKEWKIFTGFPLLGIIKPCILSKKTTIIQLKEQTTKSTETSTQEQQTTKPAVTDSMENDAGSTSTDTIKSPTTTTRTVSTLPESTESNVSARSSSPKSTKKPDDAGSTSTITMKSPATTKGTDKTSPLPGYASSTLNTKTTNDLKTTTKTGTNKVGSVSGGKMKKSTETKFTATSTKPNKKDAICGTSLNTRGQIKNVSDDGKTARFECPIGYAIKDRPAVTIICHNGAWKYVYDAAFNLTCKRATIIVNEFGEPDDRQLFWDKIDECISNGTCKDREDAIGRWFPTSKYDKESKPKKSQPLLSSQTAGFIAMVIGLLTAAQALLEIILYVRKIRAARAAREAAGHSDDESTVTDEEEHEYYYEEYFVEEEVDDFYLPPANLS